MSSDKPSVSTPGQAVARSGSNERIVPKGSIIDIRDSEDCPMCYLILSGSVAAEISEGTVLFDILQQGDTFNEQYVFSSCCVQPSVQYRALTRCALRVFDRKMILANESQAEIRDLYRAAMRTRVRQSSDTPRRIDFVLRGIRGQLEGTHEQLLEIKETLAEKEQELAATTKQMVGVQENLEAACLQASEKYRELRDYKTLVDTLESMNERLNRELKATREGAVVKTLMDEIVRAQLATKSAETALKDVKEHGRKIARALERLGKKNPGLVLDEATLMLLLGEEPQSLTLPPRPQCDDEIDHAIEQFLSEAPTKPTPALIPADRGAPGDTLRPPPSKLEKRRIDPPIPRRAPRPAEKFQIALRPPLPREEEYAEVNDNELKSLPPPPRAPRETSDFITDSLFPSSIKSANDLNRLDSFPPPTKKGS